VRRKRSASASADIAWVRKDADGEKLEVYARRVGARWDFFTRSGRHQHWEPVESPPLEDWLELLEGVRRRAQRRLYELDEALKLEALIRKRFPRAEL
jgi:hypothetical protein